ncbi:hypothetical protein [Mycolicibacterium arenosum]|uniref:Uncharacterized protein n=1 Tax=Mycolicibacterium arenosum TaxID=2952157 RepID=A0ABT1M706_9MYCO|nr:hypothetical protein [Mycolicibacterium sp. CAU 1645]MCP9274004.1 hypothetical protein [Mycolicibacterium sp. CAU 1645]
MTTTDLWIKDLSGGRGLRQRGGLFGPASDVAYVLWDFIKAGKATAHPDHAEVIDIESTVSGELLIKMLRVTERSTGKRLTESDRSRSVDCVDPTHHYRIRYIEF